MTMPYLKKMYFFKDSIEVEKVFSGRYGKHTPHREKRKPTPAEMEEVKNKENAKLLSKIKPNDFVVLLDLGKEQPDSVELSSRLEKWMRDGGSSITFVIGGSLGLSAEMRKRGNATLTLSKLTFTHQMTRVILLEQIYRSFKILRNEPYHK